MPINDPIAWWRLDDGTGSAALDSSGNGYSLALANDPTWIEGQIEGALHFTAASSQKGETSAAGLLASLQGVSEFTIAFWARAAANQSLGASIAIRDGVDTGKLLLAYPYETNGMRIFWNGDSILQQTANGPSLNEWHHFMVISRSATDHEIFTDNVSVDTSNVSVSMAATLSHVTVGAWNGGQFFDGDIDDIRIYDRALSETERMQLFEWRFDAPAGVADYGGGGHGRHARGLLPWWWTAYFWQPPDEEESEEAKLARLKAEAERLEALLAGIRRQQASERYARQERDARAAAAIERIREQHNAERREREEAGRQAEAERQAAIEAQQQAEDERRVAALERFSARRAEEDAERERREAEERDAYKRLQRGKHERYVRNRRNPFARRFETALALLMDDGWRLRKQ